jgi:hypothetical protein
LGSAGTFASNLLGFDRGDDHKDDQEHEQHVDQRRYINEWCGFFFRAA